MPGGIPARAGSDAEFLIHYRRAPHFWARKFVNEPAQRSPANPPQGQAWPLDLRPRLGGFLEASVQQSLTIGPLIPGCQEFALALLLLGQLHGSSARPPEDAS